MDKAGIRIYSDGSGFEGGIGAAAVLYRGNNEPKTLKYHLGPATEHTVYKGEGVGAMLGMELLRREKDMDCLISQHRQPSIHNSPDEQQDGTTGSTHCGHLPPTGQDHEEKQRSGLQAQGAMGICTQRGGR